MDPVLDQQALFWKCWLDVVCICLTLVLIIKARIHYTNLEGAKAKEIVFLMKSKGTACSFT